MSQIDYDAMTEAEQILCWREVYTSNRAAIPLPPGATEPYRLIPDK